jgi:DNA-binding transcriptional ArsR family regulator
LLARVFTHDDRETLAELARALGADPATVQREVTRLEDAAIVRTRRSGRNRIVEPNPDSPIYGELHALLRKVFGAPAALERALASVAGVEQAFVFGSWARRFHGESGPLPRDVDLLVIGAVDPSAVYDAIRPVEDEGGIEINPLVLSPQEWADPRGVAERVRRGALVELEVDGADAR